MSKVRVGISGWRYPGWRGVFYPLGLVQRRELEFASRKLRTIEINGSFYSLQRPSSYLRWHAETPEDFVFAIKGSKFITHNKKLRDVDGALANFFASGLLALGPKLGPILWQLPPQLPFDLERMRSFLRSLPRSMQAAAELGKGHDHRLRHGAFLEVQDDRPLRYAFEVRHPSFADPRFLELLREECAGLCIADTAGTWLAMEAVTSDLVYVRLHGSTRLYASGYSAAELGVWAGKIARWQEAGKDVFVYFDNDVEVRAPYDALNLAAQIDRTKRTPFPRQLLRAAEARRGVIQVGLSADRWKR